MRNLIISMGIFAVLAISCKQNKPVSRDPVSLSLEYQSLEDTPQPEGDPLALGMAVYAKVLCSAVFVSGRQAEEAFNNSGRILLEESTYPGLSYRIDTVSKKAFIISGDSLEASASYYGDQGCIIDNQEAIYFEPIPVVSSLPEATSMDWPMGDITRPVEGPYDIGKLQQAADSAFLPEALTAAFLVIHKGDIIIERYGQGAHKDMQLESWSMGKSLTATLIGRLIQEGKLDLDDTKLVPEWSREGDPRGDISLRNVLQMSSGLMFKSHRDPVVDTPLPLLDHMFIYSGAIDAFSFSVNRPLQFEPGTVGLYHNSDPMTLGYIVRLQAEKEGRNYLTWPQEELFDKVGIRKQVLETDPYGNFLSSGYDYGTARNWGRLGLLYLNKGNWMGEQLLPGEFVEFVSQLAPSWSEPVYGGHFWINGTGEFSAPLNSYYMAGAGGQITMIIPDYDLVVVRMGHAKGSGQMQRSLNAALDILLPAIKEVSDAL